MMWLTWRQHRAQAYAGLVLIALTALVFLSYGASMRGVYTQDGIGACLVHGTAGDQCQSVMSDFMQRFDGIANHLLTWFTPVPGLIGAIVGASLLGREYEHGTWRLAWAQAVPRTRWLTIRILLVSGGIVVTTASLSAVFGWFRSPVDQVSGRFSPGAFDLEGLSLTGYTLFAFAAGVLAGLLFRRIVPAIVAALVAFMAVRLPVEFWLRPRYETPVTRLVAPTANFVMGPMAVPTRSGPPDWVLGRTLIGRNGHALGGAVQERVLQHAASFTSPGAGDSYLRGLGLHVGVLVQPENRFWTFQIIECSLFVGLAAVLLGIAVWRLRRRVL